MLNKFSFNNIIKIKMLNEYSNKYFILLNGNNLLMSDKGYDDLNINTPEEENFSELKEFNEITFGGGIFMRTLSKSSYLLSYLD